MQKLQNEIDELNKSLQHQKNGVETTDLVTKEEQQQSCSVESAPAPKSVKEETNSDHLLDNGAKLEKLQQELHMLNSQYQEMESKYECEKSLCSSLQDKNNELEKQLSASNSQVSGGAIGTSLNEPEPLQSSLVVKDDEMLLKSSSSEKDENFEKLEKLQQELDMLNSQYQEMESKYECEKSLCSSLQDKNNELEKELSPINSQASGDAIGTRLIEPESLQPSLVAKDDDMLLKSSASEKDENFEKLQKQMMLLEEQLMQTRQLKDQYEDKIEELKTENERLKTASSDNHQRRISFVEESLSSANPLEPTFGENNDSTFKLEILQQQLEEKHLEMASMETNLKSEVCELQQSAENQERLVAKLECENKQLIRQSYELNDDVLTKQERIDELMNENNHLSALLSLNDKDNVNNSEKPSYDSMSQSGLRFGSERDLQHTDQEIEALKEEIQSRDMENQELLKCKDNELTRLEKQIELLQNDLDRRVTQNHDLSVECEQLRMLRDKEEETSVQQETYLLYEIERVQSEYKQKAHSVEEDKDNQIALIRSDHEERIFEMEVEFENRKSVEIETIREDYLTQIESLESQRAELMVALRKLENTKLTGENDNDDSLEKNGERQNEGRINDIISMLANLECHMNQKNKQYNNPPASDLNKTWPATTYATENLTESYDDERHFDFREQIEQARSDLSMQIRDLSKIFPITPTSPLSPTASLNGSAYTASFEEINAFDYEDHHHHPMSASSPLTPKQAPKKTHHPASVFRRSPQPPATTNFRHDSGIESSVISSSYHQQNPYLSSSTNNGGVGYGSCEDQQTTESSPKLLHQKQLRDLMHSFQRFDLQCRLVGSTTDFSNEKWFIDLQAWRERVNTRLRKIEQHYLNEEDSLFNSIIFRPSNLEIREIIADVNKKYDRYKTNEV